MRFREGDEVKIMGLAAATVVEVWRSSREYICSCGSGRVRVSEGFVVDYSISLQEAAELSGKGVRALPGSHSGFLSMVDRLRRDT